MRRVIPCQLCSSPTCELELPVLDGVAAQLFRPMLRLAAAKCGFELDPLQGNPLEGLSAEAIAELLSTRCLACVEVRDRPSIQAHA